MRHFLEESILQFTSHNLTQKACQREITVQGCIVMQPETMKISSVNINIQLLALILQCSSLQIELSWHLNHTAMCGKLMKNSFTLFCGRVVCMPLILVEIRGQLAEVNSLFLPCES